MKNLIKNMILSIWDNKVHFFSLILLLLTSLSLTWGIFSANLAFSNTLTNWNNISNSSDAILDLNASTFFSHKKMKDQFDKLPGFFQDISDSLKDPELQGINFTYRDYRTFYDNKNNKKAILIPYADQKDNEAKKYFINNEVDKIFFNHDLNQNDNQKVVYLATEYAKKNNLDVGDNIDFNNFFSTNNTEKKDDPYLFKLQGYANSFDVSYPKIDLIDTVPQTKNAEIAYINWKFLLNKEGKDNFETRSYSDRDQVLLFHFPEGSDKKTLSQKLYQKVKDFWIKRTDISKPNNLAFPTFGYYDKYNNQFETNNLWYSRTTTFDYFVTYENDISLIFLLAINLTIFFVVAIIARKRIDSDENNILIFKSLGFKKKKITFVYSFYPFFFTIFLSLFALGFSFLFQKILFSLFNNFFMVSIEKVSFSWISFVIDICLYALVISALTFISVYFLIQKKMAKSI